MSMLVIEMKAGIKCYVDGPSVSGDPWSTHISSKALILEKPTFSTVYVELENPPECVGKRCRVPITSVYWRKQD